MAELSSELRAMAMLPFMLLSPFFTSRAMAAFCPACTAGGGYAVFGKVVSGAEVLDAMASVKTTTAYGLADFPASNVIVLSATQTK